MNKVSFALVIHAHQPVGNFDHVIEEAFRKSYAPFLAALHGHPQVRMSLHYSGILLDWLEKHHPEYFHQLRQLAGRGQIELVGGGFFEPILPSIPDADKVLQLRKLAAYLEQHFGSRPRGAWIAERVWEPSLPRCLAEASVEYVVLDDTHFLAAGLDPGQLRGYYMTDEAGAPLRLVPSLKALRYTIPFREPEETIAILRQGLDHGQPLFAMGDDCEKFGVWPGTYDHVYKNRWLERFLTAIEGSREWLETTTVADYLRSHSPLGNLYLPTASYDEMMEWALPAGAATEFKACLEESERLPYGQRFRRFLRGGLWRNFLSKYSESNQLHKLMLETSRRCKEARRHAAPESAAAPLLEEAQTHVLAAQCNDAYWHGVFGGLYAPHLRSALLRHIVQAEALLDRVEGAGKNPAIQVTQADFDVDGQDEILASNSTFGMILRPGDGGTVSSLRFKPADAEIVNSLMRRPEAYHALIRHRVQTHQVNHEGPASIHDMVLSKESNLDALLRYDRHARHAFRTYVFRAGKQWPDFDNLRLEEDLPLAQGRWECSAAHGEPGRFDLKTQTRLALGECEVDITAQKRLTTQVVQGSWQLECRTSLATPRPCPAGLALGVELVFNLLAPDAPDRYFLAEEVRRPLEFRGELLAPQLDILDEWQRVKISLNAYPQPRWWIVPIETISQSESGFERVYQGSAILVVWAIEPQAWRNVTRTVRAEISSLPA